MSDDVPQFRWWYRWAMAAGVLLLSGLALAFAVPELLRLIADLRTFPPVITTSNGWTAMLPLGLGILAILPICLSPPVLDQRRRKARGEPPRTGMLPQTKLFLVGLTGALITYPLLTIGADMVIGSILERHGYRWTEIDHGHSRLHEYRWTRARG